MKDGSYVNIWVPRNATVQDEPEDCEDYEPINFGYVNHSFKKSEESQVVGLGFAPIEDRIEDCKYFLLENLELWILKNFKFRLQEI